MGKEDAVKVETKTEAPVSGIDTRQVLSVLVTDGVYKYVYADTGEDVKSK